MFKRSCGFVGDLEYLGIFRVSFRVSLGFYLRFFKGFI